MSANQEEIKILDMLSAGVISTDEAYFLLKSLEKKPGSAQGKDKKCSSPGITPGRYSIAIIL